MSGFTALCGFVHFGFSFVIHGTLSFPLSEKIGKKRTPKEGYAPSLGILPQVGASSTEGSRKETPAEAIGAHQFLANPWMSLSRFKSSKKDSGFMLRLKVSPRSWKTSEVRFSLGFLVGERAVSEKLWGSKGIRKGEKRSGLGTTENCKKA